MFAVPSHAVEDSAAAMSVVVDCGGDFFPVLGGEYDELYGLPVGVDYLVGHERDDEENDETIDQTFDTFV